MDWVAVASGFGIGAIVGLTGVGGGSLMTPLLLGVFKLNPAVAIGTDLWFAATTKLAGAGAHHGQGQVDWRITRRLLAGSVPATLATVAWLHATGGGAVAMHTLTFGLGVALLLTALALAFKKHWQGAGLRLARHLPGHRLTAATVLAGATLGVLVTLTSIGAGALGAMLILLLYPALPAQRLVGTDIAHAVPLTLLAAVGHASLGHVHWGLLAYLLLGSIPGIWLGSRLSRSLPERLVRALLCASLVTAGLKVIT